MPQRFLGFRLIEKKTWALCNAERPGLLLITEISPARTAGTGKRPSISHMRRSRKPGRALPAIGNGYRKGRVPARAFLLSLGKGAQSSVSRSAAPRDSIRPTAEFPVSTQNLCSVPYSFTPRMKLSMRLVRWSSKVAVALFRFRRQTASVNF